MFIIILVLPTTTVAEDTFHDTTPPSRSLKSPHVEEDDKQHATSYAQRHPNRHYYTTNRNSPYYSGEFASYYEDDDAYDDGFPRRRRRHDHPHRTELSDVLLCMCTALAWAVWVISAYQSPTTRGASRHEVDERFGTHHTTTASSCLLVHGNVLQVQQIEEEPLPKYRSVIDYVIVSEHTQESLQIRKQFETTRALQVGFANVELLVLPEDPTQSCIKQELEEETTNDGDTTSGGCQRFSMAVAIFLVVASVAGTVQVIYLMNPDERRKGWIVLFTGLVLLFPCAFIIHKFVKLLAAEPGGVIVGRKEHSMERAACLAPSCMGAEIPEVASYVVPEASGCYFVHYEKPRCFDSEAPYDNVSSASTISSISDNSPNTGKILWPENDKDSF